MLAKTSALLLALCAMTAQAQDYVPRDPEAWERANAWRLSSTTESEARKDSLIRLARAGDSGAALAELQALDRAPDLPAPARERALFEFITALRDEPPHTISPDILGYLANYPNTVFVPHEDHPRNQVPLFSIRTATAGLENSWTRQESALRGKLLLARDPLELVEVYAASAARQEQRGLLDALYTAAPVQRERAALEALRQMDSSPGLSELVGTAALLNDDPILLEGVLEHAPADGLHRLLRDGAARFSPQQNARLLESALNSHEPGVASLAIAELAPSLADDADIVNRLFAELAVPETGAAAALALAGYSDPAVLSRLEGIAQERHDSLAGSRALLALQLMEAAVLGDTQ